MDERLMQMLHSANAGLHADEASAYRGLHARTFAVVPLGPTTGLIEWVDHSAPLFGIYQAWQRCSALTSGRHFYSLGVWCISCFSLCRQPVSFLPTEVEG